MTTFSPSPLAYEELNAMLEVHELEIEKDLAKQASIHQMVCEHVGTLVEALGKIKIEEKAVEGLLRGNLKAKEAAKGGKVTDKDADAAVACDQELIDVGNRRAEIEGMLEKWKGLRESFRQRNEDIIGYKDLIRSGYISHYRQIQTSNLPDK